MASMVCRKIGPIDDILAVSLFVDFCGCPNCPICLGFGINLGSHLAWFLGCLQTLKMKLKCQRGCQNHTLDFFFAGTDSRSAFATELFMMCVIFGVFEGSIWGTVA